MFKAKVLTFNVLIVLFNWKKLAWKCVHASIYTTVSQIQTVSREGNYVQRQMVVGQLPTLQLLLHQTPSPGISLYGGTPTQVRVVPAASVPASSLTTLLSAAPVVVVSAGCSIVAVIIMCVVGETIG